VTFWVTSATALKLFRRHDSACDHKYKKDFRIYENDSGKRKRQC